MDELGIGYIAFHFGMMEDRVFSCNVKKGRVFLQIV